MVALEFKDVRKSYGRVEALRGVSFSVSFGEIHALLGKNGAGKSTLIRILAGATTPDSGAVLLDGAHVDNASPWKALGSGIRVVHQELTLLPHLSVWQNIAAGFQSTLFGAIVDRRRTVLRVTDVLRQLGADIDPYARIGSLTLANQQIVEIARALFAGGRVLVLDEPNSALTKHETDRLLSLLTALASQGMAVILVSHRLEEVLSIAHRVTVLRDGMVRGTWPVSGISIRTVIQEMLGSLIGEGAEQPPLDRQAEAVLQLQGLTGPAVGPLDLTVRRGQIIGIAGLEGCGAEALLQTIGGNLGPPAAGEVVLRGRRVSLHSPSAAIQHGVIYTPPDRRIASWLSRSIEDNIVSSALGPVAFFGVLRPKAKRNIANHWAARLGLVCDGTGQPVSSLSGGNQQRVLLARSLNAQPIVLLMEDPTRGVDVQAKADFHRLLASLAQAGLVILMTSTDIPELLVLAHAIVCMRNGQITRIASAATLSEAEILEEITTAAPVSGQ